MKALTLTQPWASLVAIGAKQIETRSWRTPYRGPLAIHAAKGWTKADVALFFEAPFREPLTAAGYKFYSQLPRGAVIATCRLIDCRPTEIIVPSINGTAEVIFGNYELGRWAWLLADIQKLPEPIPARGALSLWDWNPEAGPNPGREERQARDRAKLQAWNEGKPR